MHPHSPLYVLEFSGSSLQCCRSEMRRRSRRLTHCFIVRDREGVLNNPRVLARHFRKHGFRPIDPIVVIPRHLASVQTLRLPSQDKHELEEMVRLHISRNSGPAGEEVVYDYQFAGLDAQGYALVHVYSLPKSRLEYYLIVLKKMGLNPSLVTFNVEGMGRWLLLQKASREATGRSLCLLNAGPDGFDFNVFCDGRIYFSRSFSFSPITGLERASLLLREIKMSLELCRRLGGVEFIFDKKIYVAGSFSPEELQALKSHSFFDAVVIEDVIQAGNPFLRSLPAEERLSFASSLGLAMNPENGCMDMRPPECKAEARGRAVGRWWHHGAFLFCGLVFILWFLYAAKVVRDADAFTRLRHEMAAQKDVMTIGDAVARGVWVENHFVATGIYKEILSVLGRHSDENIMIDELRVQGGAKISLKGSGKDMTHVLDYVKSLKSERVFQKARLEYLIQNKDAQTGGPVSFKVVSP
ncbi:MAG: type IV pilus biogenesis protein PilM [Candidatus Velamenicoccus archaeovorus]